MAAPPSDSNERATRLGRPKHASALAKPSSSLDNAETVDAAGIVADAPVSELPYGGMIGRYLVLSVLGRGGMGVVYAAYDPVLDRKIAVKLLRYVLADGESEGRARMQREAQALGRLNHPNVITVHDVGEHQGSMYIAMEIVEGGTLRDWQDDKSWREIVEAYLSAARGVAAAHAASLVHRDLKPENVLMGHDGRVRVTDFGLARLGALPQPADPRQHLLSPTASVSGSLTIAGAVMGTPFYMAPEQIDGGVVDARSDQFSLCIALWEALYRQQPFPGTMLALRSAAMKAEPPVPPAKTQVPRAIGRALVRGLAGEPDARWPTLDDLAAELRRSAQRGGSRRAAFAIGLALVAALALVFALGHRAGAGTETDCASAAKPAESLWTPEVRADIARGFAETGAPFAAAAAASLDRGITTWRAHWQGDAVASCAATRAGAQSDAMLDLRTACLERRRIEMATFVAALGHADRALVARAPEMALPDLDTCADTAALGGVVPAPRDPAVHVAQQRVETRLDALERESLHGFSLPRAHSAIVDATLAVIDATAVGWAPLLARARRDLAEVQHQLGAGKDARATLMAAAAASEAAMDLDGLVDAELQLIDNETRLTSDFELAEGWGMLAAGALERLGPRVDKEMRLARERGYALQRAGHPRRGTAQFKAALALARSRGTPLELMTILNELAGAEGEAGLPEESIAHANEALAIAKVELGDHHPIVAAIEHDLGAAAIREGHAADAVSHLQRALALRQELLGADSLPAAMTEETLGIAELALDQIDASTQHTTEALATLEARLGPDHPDVANALNDVGGAYHRAGLYERALANCQRTLAMRERVLGPNHPDVGQSLVNMAIEAKALDRWDVVFPAYDRAIPIFEKAYGTDSADVGLVYLNHAEALRVHGDLDTAGAEYKRAQAALVKSLGEDTPLLAHIWNGTGQLALARGNLDDARPLLERAVTIREKDAGDAIALAESRFALARALPAAAHARAATLARQALVAYRTGGKPFDPQRAGVDAWLAAHP